MERSIREVREEFQDALALAQTEMQGTLSGAIARFEAAREVSCNDHREVLGRLQELTERVDGGRWRTVVCGAYPGGVGRFGWC